jgi:hypothetical protein
VQIGNSPGCHPSTSHARREQHRSDGLPSAQAGCGLLNRRAWTARRRRGARRTSRIGLPVIASWRTAIANICASTLRETRVVRPLRSTRVSATSTTPVLASINRSPPRRWLTIRDSAAWYPAKICGDTAPLSLRRPLS